MHYTTRVQIAQERQIAGMMIATNALQIGAQIRNEEPPKTARAMAENLRDIVLSLPRYRQPGVNISEQGLPDAREQLRAEEPGVLRNSS